ncbi:Peroxisomal membrane signal receptor PTS1 [Actinomortierella ambigua]|nr:Peroxisomal membrane signal receptor PTS1 [Actinomortierella ambigua]
MSFQSMVSGAECGSSSNAMRQFTKHFNQDTTLKHERFANAPATQGPSMRTAGPAMGVNDQQLLDEFFDQQQKGGEPAAFRFNDMRQELGAIHRGPGFAPPGGDWGQEFQAQQGARIFEMNPEEQAAFENAFQHHQAPPHEWQEEFMRHEHVAGEMPAEFEAAFQKNFDWANEFALVEGKGKGKAVDAQHFASWEAEFDAVQQANATSSTSKGVDFGDEKEQLEDLWSTLRDNLTDTEDLQNILEDPTAWDSEFADLGNVAAGPVLGPYTFEPNNPYMSHPNPLEEGVRLVREGGSLSEAALCFEAAVQRDDNNSQAWMMLGNTQAQNEKEEPAIRALERAVEVDANNLEALMALAVSYTNEGYDHQTHLTLEKWLGAKYPEIIAANGPQAPTTAWETHERVTDLFLQAVRQAPDGAALDADVQVGLGVLFYGVAEYDKAVDCFEAGLKARPNDYLLWNRLGATLANSGRSEDAIEAYHKALEIKPSFVRARYNLGISCINIGCHREAVEHLLGALSMHQTEGQPGPDGAVNASSNLWETLRRTFMMMGRSDLAEKAVVGADLNQFRGEFEF